MAKPTNDPRLLGVAVPLHVTKQRATEITGAWRDCIKDIVAAARSKRAASKSSAN
jgi:hypothetical protein